MSVLLHNDMFDLSHGCSRVMYGQNVSVKTTGMNLDAVTMAVASWCDESVDKLIAPSCVS